MLANFIIYIFFSFYYEMEIEVGGGSGKEKAIRSWILFSRRLGLSISTLFSARLLILRKTFLFIPFSSIFLTRFFALPLYQPFAALERSSYYDELPYIYLYIRSYIYSYSYLHSCTLYRRRRWNFLNYFYLVKIPSLFRFHFFTFTTTSPSLGIKFSSRIIICILKSHTAPHPAPLQPLRVLNPSLWRARLANPVKEKERLGEGKRRGGKSTTSRITEFFNRVEFIPI